MKLNLAYTQIEQAKKMLLPMVSNKEVLSVIAACSQSLQRLTEAIIEEHTNWVWHGGEPPLSEHPDLLSGNTPPLSEGSSTEAGGTVGQS